MTSAIGASSSVLITDQARDAGNMNTASTGSPTRNPRRESWDDRRPAVRPIARSPTSPMSEPTVPATGNATLTATATTTQPATSSRPAGEWPVRRPATPSAPRDAGGGAPGAYLTGG